MRLPKLPAVALLATALAVHADQMTPEVIAPLPVGKLAIVGNPIKGETTLYYIDQNSPAVHVGEFDWASFLQGGKLAYGNTANSFVRDLANGSTAKLALPVSAYGFDFAPNGTDMLFVMPKEKSSNIHVSNVDGTNQRPLTQNKESDSAWEPKWSPNGKHILFLSNHDIKDKVIESQVFVMDANGSNQSLRSGSAGIYTSPCWSPDGSQIAFVSLRDTKIHIMKSDGTSPKVIDKSDVVQPLNRIAWSPDGKWIAYGRGAKNPGHGIWIVRPDGSGETQIITSKERGIHWQPLSWTR